MQLSEHFTLREFITSQTAARMGIKNNPRPEHMAPMIELCEECLEPVRALLGMPITISSGYRSYDLNKAIGGSQTSQHSKGEAADLVLATMAPYDVCKAIADSDIEFDQLILEQRDEHNGWTHISYRKGNNRREILTAHFQPHKPTVYTRGLDD